MNLDYDKDAWIKSLKVGDVVCDCRYEHVKIKNISEATPSGDRVLYFADDFSCSARHCADPAEDHEHWIVYILKCKDGSLYTGITNNLNRRIAQHNKGTASKYTRGRGPVKCIRVHRVDSKSEALKLEYHIKQLSKQAKLDYEQ